jgi:hypothetical protein
MWPSQLIATNPPASSLHGEARVTFVIALQLCSEQFNSPARIVWPKTKCRTVCGAGHGNSIC